MDFSRIFQDFFRIFKSFLFFFFSQKSFFFFFFREKRIFFLEKKKKKKDLSRPVFFFSFTSFIVLFCFFSFTQFLPYYFLEHYSNELGPTSSTTKTIFHTILGTFRGDFATLELKKPKNKMKPVFLQQNTLKSTQAQGKTTLTGFRTHFLAFSAVTTHMNMP